MIRNLIHISESEAKYLLPELDEIIELIETKLSKEVAEKRYTNASVYRDLKTKVNETKKRLDIYG